MVFMEAVPNGRKIDLPVALIDVKEEAGERC